MTGAAQEAAVPGAVQAEVPAPAGFDDRVAAWRARLPKGLPPAGGDLLVALDLDGTLLGGQGVASERVRHAVARLHRAGTHMVLATGRSILAAGPVAEQLGLSQTYTVCSNGAVLVWLGADGPEVTDVVTFDPGPAVRLLQEAMPTLLIAVEDAQCVFRTNAPFPMGDLITPEVVGPAELVATPAARVTVRAPDLPGETFQDMVHQLGLDGVSYAVTTGHSAWLDITPDGVTKATGLETVRKRLGIGRGASVAIGDGGNDVEMLRWAAHGVAMGHAQPDVIAAADARTDSVDHDGAAVVLQALLAPDGTAGQ